MNFDVIQRLIDVLESSGVDEIEVRSWWGRRVRVTRRASSREVVAVTDVRPTEAASTTPGALSAKPPVASSVDPSPAPEAVPDDGLLEIISPMVGTFYLSPSPDSDPFVTVGSRVSADTVVCIVEAMKIFNEIESEVAGEIVECLVDSGQPVEHGQPLFRVRPR